MRSIHALRHVSDSTGGLAAVNTNDLAGAFDRIVDESSDYYVIGYTPAKPGDFRDIDVRATRPGVKVIARKGYTVPRRVPPLRRRSPNRHRRPFQWLAAAARS